MIGYLVVQLVNGGTDWYDVAWFEEKFAAQEFCAELNLDLPAGVELSSWGSEVRKVRATFSRVE